MKIINLFICMYLFFNGNSYAARNKLEERNEVQACSCGHKAIHSYDPEFTLGYEVTLINPQNNEEFYWSEVAYRERCFLRPLLCKGCLSLVLFIDNYEKEMDSSAEENVDDNEKEIDPSDEENADDMEEDSYDLTFKDYFGRKTYVETHVLDESFVYFED